MARIGALALFLPLAAASCDEGRPPRLDGDWVLDGSRGDAGRGADPSVDASARRPVDDPVSPVSEAEFLERAQPQLCNAVDGCCAALGVVAGSIDCTPLDPGPDASLGAARYDAELGGRCLRDVAAFASDCGNFDPFESCGHVYAGDRAPGEPCERIQQCARVDGAEVSCTGVCEIERDVGEGEACSDDCDRDGIATICGRVSDRLPEHERARCFSNDGLACSSEGVCTRLPVIGESCEGAFACSPGAYCRFDASGSQCQRRLDEGSACDYGSDCRGGLYCGGEPRTCRPQKSEGSACDPLAFDECQSYCDDDGRCAPPNDPATFALGLLCAVLLP